MGMDVIGSNPASRTGEYFRANVWCWKPLWGYCDNNYKVAKKVSHGYSNDGDGLNEDDSKELSELLFRDLANGTVAKYKIDYDLALAELPRQNCTYCEATGIRTDEVGVEHGMPTKQLEPEIAILTGRTIGWCNACGGEGTSPHWASNYPFHIELVQGFAKFLKDCGGFSIH
jgi:hypothetical protein